MESNEIVSVENMEKMITLDEGMEIFSDFRLSPMYLKKAKKNAFAMIRQKGTPTYFQSFSAADTRWADVLGGMYVTKYERLPTIETLNNLSYAEKIEILNSDHIKGAQLFYNRIEKLVNMLKSKNCPLGQMTDYFYRIESQKRGKLHLHILSYHQSSLRLSEKELNDIKEGKNNKLQNELYAFIDDRISCKLPRHDDPLRELLSLIHI